MGTIKTANTSRHNFDKNFNRYVRNKSKRSLNAILRTKRLDAGFFFLEFYPMLRDFFIDTHNVNERDFEIILQLHANQPFSIDDVYECTTRPYQLLRNIPWASKFKLNMGRRAAMGLLSDLGARGIIETFKNHGRCGKKLYVISPNWSSDIRSFYENLLCLRKVRTIDNKEFPTDAKKSPSHYRKALRQNIYKDAFDGTSIKMKSSEVEVRLSEAKSLS
jgi:hypothetical protein